MLRIACFLFIFSPSLAIAMQALDEQSLAEVSGADGLTVALESLPGISADQLKWVTDDNGLNDGSCSGGTASQHACTQLEGLELKGVGGPLHLQQKWDVGSDDSGVPYLGLQSEWGSPTAPFQMVVGGLTFNTENWNASGNSLGQLALRSLPTWYSILLLRMALPPGITLLKGCSALITMVSSSVLLMPIWTSLSISLTAAPHQILILPVAVTCFVLAGRGGWSIHQ